MSRAKDVIDLTIKVSEDEDLGIFLNNLFPIINGSGTKMRAERVSGKPTTMLIKYGSHQYQVDVRKIK